MNLACLAAAAALIVSWVGTSQADLEELRKLSKIFMDRYYKGLIRDFERLMAEGKSYSVEEMRYVAADISIKEFSKNIAKMPELIKLHDKLVESGELGDFKIYKQGNHRLEREIERLIMDLISKDEVSPRVIGAAITGITQIITDTIRMLLTRYTEPR